jgi:hypothetical protein
VKEITNGIWYVLPLGVAPEEMNDIVQEAQVFLLERGGNAYNAGRRFATVWKRRNYKVSVSGTRKRELTFEDLKRTDDEGNEEPFDLEDLTEVHTPTLDVEDAQRFLASMRKCFPEAEGIARPVEDINVIRQFTELRKAEPEAYAVAVAYFSKKSTPGNRFTREQSAQFERALRRLNSALKRIKCGQPRKRP